MGSSTRVLVTGAGGFMARHLIPLLEQGGFEVIAKKHSELEISDGTQVGKTVSELRPDIVVNCAAIASTGYAKEHPEESYAANVTGCVNLARACAESGAGLYVMSSDQVYGGCAGTSPLKEDAASTPNNIYGAQKLEMEKLVLGILPEAVALRLDWMYEPYNAGCPHTDIVSRLVQACDSGTPIKFSTREYRGMADMDEVCGNIIAGFGRLPGGVYNFGSSNNADTCSTMVRIAEAAGIDRRLILPDDSWGRNISMDCSRLESFGISFRSTEEALVSILSR